MTGPIAEDTQEMDLWGDDICALVDAAFALVSRNPSDHESATAYRIAIRTALDQASQLAGVVGERDALRAAMIRSGRAAGAFLADNVSTEFLLLVPAEIEAKIAALGAKL